MSVDVERTMWPGPRKFWHGAVEPWQRQLAQEEYKLGLLKDRLSRATSLGKRARFVKRIHKGQARIMALKLAHS